MREDKHCRSNNSGCLPLILLFIAAGLLGNLGTQGKQNTNESLDKKNQSDFVSEIKIESFYKQSDFVSEIKLSQKPVFVDASLNDLKKALLRAERQAKFERIFKHLTVSRWRGRLIKMWTNSDSYIRSRGGDAHITIQFIGSNIKLETRYFSPIRLGSDLYNKISELTINEIVEFSGKFYDNQYLRVDDEPEFEFEFSEVKKHVPTATTGKK